MKEKHLGNRLGFAKIIGVILGLALSGGCSSDHLGDEAGGFGGFGGFGGSGVRADESEQAVVDDGELAALGSPEQTELVSPTHTAVACTLPSQCASGFCVDGFCCDNGCANKCMACSAAKKGGGLDGICGSVAANTDPDNDCPAGECDGKNMCRNYNGVACTSSAQCLSKYCVDGFCCGNICMGSCQACSAAKKGSGSDGVCGSIKVGTDPDNECSGSCNGAGACDSSPQPKFPNGTACTGASQCNSGFCADGVCCDSWCLGNCQACTAAKKKQGLDGVCGNIAYDQDPDEECWGGGCNGQGLCKQYNGVPCSDRAQCLSNYCVDGFCCGNICNQMCYACSEAKKGQGYDGVCGPIIAGKDVENECNPGECGGSGTCNQPQTPQVSGTACVSGGQCATGNCVDGVCCDTACAGACTACTAAKKGSGPDGICGNIASETDPDKECNGGKCDGKGVCRYYNGAPCSSTGQCFSNYCVDGFCCGNICTGACQACSTAKKGSGFDGVCGPIANATDPDNECNPGECNGANNCNQPQAMQPNGAICSQATQCTSGFCVDGVCCDSACPGNCLACTIAKKGQGTNGTCGPIITGTDPDNECMNSDCNGSGGCTTPMNLPNGSACNTNAQCTSMNCVDGVCCNTACTGACVACSAAKKGSGSDGTCGPIKFDTDPDDECFGGGCNGNSACGYYNGVLCNTGSQCLSTYCVDGYCCNHTCLGTCQACSLAKKGTGFDGVCGYVKANTDPDNECSGVCNGSGVCIAPTCMTSAECGTNATCTNSTCVCNSGYSGDGFNCTDVDECQISNGGCSANATCTNTPGSRTCACNSGWSGDGITCSDIDECMTNNGGCDPNATCTNTPGSRTCACNMGYTGDGITCTFAGQITSVSSGYFSACAKANDNRVKCWGSNAMGVLGIGNSTQMGDEPNEMGGNLPALNLGTGRTISQVSVGTTHACAVLDNGTVKCWGENASGQLGLGDTLNRGSGANDMGDNLPTVDLGTGLTALQVSVSTSGYSCALLTGGVVKCWGDNAFGQLGQGDTVKRGDNTGEMGDNLPPILLGLGRTAVAISVGSVHACARLDNGSVKCWGHGQFGECGYGDLINRGDDATEMGDNLPAVDLGTGRTAVALTAGPSHTCAVLDDGNLKCWGFNMFGQLGISGGDRGDEAGEMGDNLPNVPLGTGKTVSSVAIGNTYTCALLTDNTVKCWGQNVVGQLGLGNTLDIGLNPAFMGDNLPPVDLGTGKTATAIAARGVSVCALLNDSTLKCWGNNSNGQLGLGDTMTRGDGPGEMGDNLPNTMPF